MRMWMVEPRLMCRKHLLGEHLEMHMFLGSLKKKLRMNGYINNNLLEPKKIKERHDELANEIIKRGYNHKTPIQFNLSHISYLPESHQNTIIDKSKSQQELITRCQECKLLSLKNES